MNLLVVGASHRTAEVPLLEKLSVPVEDRGDVLDALLRREHVTEAVVLSTCNRVEVYAGVTGFHGGVAEVSEALAQRAGVDPAQLTPHLYVCWDAEAVRHALRVAAGLDSMVAGEAQILGQVREAYAAAAETDAAGRLLHELMQQALLLRRLAEDAELALGEAVRDVVITVPAYFDDARRRATLDAGEIAGLRVLRLINEPTAAAIAYGLESLATGNLFVYDLGGGTFDVTVMRARAGALDVIATDGDRNLGGFDFDNALMRHVAGRVLDQGGPDLHDVLVLEADLRDKCELAKRQLTTVDQASIFISAGDRNYRIQITRAEFEEMARPLLDRTEVTASGVLDDAGLGWADIDHVVLVGGSTRMRMVREMIERISGRTPATGVNPDEAVALGAAVVAAQAAAEAAESTGTATTMARVAVRDVASQSLGIIAVDEDLRRNTIVIPRNTRIPAKHERIYYTVEYDQRAVEVEVTEGDDEDLAYVAVLGARPIPLTPGLPKSSPLRVVMSYDIDGVIHVELYDVANQAPLGEFELDRPYNLDRSQVDQARTELATREVQ